MKVFEFRRLSGGIHCVSAQDMDAAWAILQKCVDGNVRNHYEWLSVTWPEEYISYPNIYADALQK